MKNYPFLICVILVLMAPIIAAGNQKINVFSANSNIIKIVAIGDSISYGTGDPLKIGFVGRFKEQFERHRGIPIQISNFGVPKYKTEDILKQLQDEKIKKRIHESNYIILNIGTNDFRKSAEYKFDNINLVKMNDGKNGFSENLYQILGKIRNENAHGLIIVMGLYNPYTENKNHLQLLDLINNWNNEIIIIVRHFDNIIFVPTCDLFSGKPKKNYFSDSLHPNAAGYKLITNRLLDRMISIDSKNKLTKTFKKPCF